MKKLLAIARGQCGAFSRAQARAAGVTDSALRMMRRRGIIERRHEGIYVFAGAHPTFEQWMHVCTLWAGPGTVVSHLSAALLHGLDVEPHVLQITVPTSRHGGDEVRIHRNRLAADDVVRRKRLPCTSIHRTLLDITAADPILGERLFDEALTRRKTTLKAMEFYLEHTARKGVRGSAGMRAFIEERRSEARPIESTMERRFMKLVRAEGLPRPTSQHRIKTRRTTYRIDFAFIDRRLAVEVDTWRYHSGRQKWNRDLDRRNDLTVAGWTCVHITSDAIVNRPKEVAALILTAYLDRAVGT